jgi:hypothetical protein
MLGCIGPWQEALELGEDCWPSWPVDPVRIWWGTALAAFGCLVHAQQAN